MNNNQINEDDISELNNEIINNYIHYSRNYLSFCTSLLNSMSRNDERIYNLIYLLSLNRDRRQNNNIPSRFFNDSETSNIFHHERRQNENPIINRASVRNENLFTNNRPSRTRRNVSNNNRNVRSRPNNIQRDHVSIFNDAFNNDNIENIIRGAFDTHINNFTFPSTLEPVAVFPSIDQINNACEDISFNLINNPVNSSCPITLERFTESSTVTQIIYCGHCYLPGALRTWFRSNVRCPICRYDIRTYNPLLVINNPYRRILANPQNRRIQTPYNRDMSQNNTQSGVSEEKENEDEIIENNNDNIEETDNTRETDNIEETDNNEDDRTVPNNITRQISNQMRDNLNTLLLNDISLNNIYFSDPSNNGPIIDLSYQIFFN